MLINFHPDHFMCQSIGQIFLIKNGFHKIPNDLGSNPTMTGG